jgi:rare lipoprotein A (peptidoglycan hydrolase)
MKRILAVFFFAALWGVMVVNAQTQEGRGTWYETDSKGLTASHANLPLGTRVRVTNLQNDRTVIVTINNRIVETPNRLIDISKAAADNLEMNSRGTTPVRIEVLSRRTAATTPAVTNNVIPPVIVVDTPTDDVPPQSSNDDELTVSTSATARRPASTAPAPDPAPAQAPTNTNPGIVNQTIITINGTPLSSGQAGSPVVISTDPAYAATPEGASAMAGAQPSVVSPAFAAPAPAVVSPNPAVVAPAPAVVSPTPAVIAPVIVPPVIAQPVLTPPVLVPPVISEPIVTEPIVTEPVRSNPVTVPSSPRTTTPAPPEEKAPPIQMQPAPPLSSPSSGVVPARIIPRRPDPASHAIYRVQVGAFLDERNAVEAYRRLMAAGLNPAYERYNDYYRVVLSGIRANEIENVAWRLGAANFSEALLREER